MEIENPVEQLSDEEVSESSRPKPKKLTDWENPPTVKQLEADVTEAKSDFDVHISEVKRWLEARDARLKVKIPKGQSKISPKLIRKQNEWRYASLTEPFLASDDMFRAVPVTFKDKDAAYQNELILNKQWRIDIDRVSFIDEYVRTAVDEGTVFVKVGWQYEEEEVVLEKPVYKTVPVTDDPMQLQQLQMAVAQGQMSPEQLYKQVYDGTTEEVETRIVTNKPTVEIIDYDKILIDPTCGGDLNNAKFVVHQFWSSKAELKEDPKYTNVEAINTSEDVNANILNASDDDIINGTFRFSDEPRKKILVTEYWGEWDIDGDGTTVPIVAAWVGSTMIRLEENPFPDQKPPFVKVVYLPKRGDIYGGEPDAVLIEDNQDIIGAITRGMIDLMGKSANSQIGVSADALDPANKIRFEKGLDYIFNPGVDPTKAFFMHTYPEIPRSALEMIQLMTNEAESITGIKSFQSGISGDALGSSATGVRSALDATSKRELGILRRLSKGLVEIGRKIIAMNAVNLNDEEVIKISDDEEVVISRNALDGEFDLQLEVSTPEADNEKAQDLAFMLQTIGNNMDPEFQKIILADIARLKKMPDLEKKIKNFEPKPDPMQEQMAQMQMQLLQAQIQNEAAKAQENQSDAQLNQVKIQETLAKVEKLLAEAGVSSAKIGTEEAKTRALHSGSDMTDLDFLQKQAGTQHKQQMEQKELDFNHELGKKAAESLLDKETPNNFDDILGPNSTKNIENLANGGKDLVGMDTPQENLEDSLEY